LKEKKKRKEHPPYWPYSFEKEKMAPLPASSDRLWIPIQLTIIVHYLSVNQHASLLGDQEETMVHPCCNLQDFHPFQGIYKTRLRLINGAAQT
jgi:hypothetical protein